MNNKIIVMKKILIACLLVAFTSCVGKGSEVEVSGSKDEFKVEKLFVVDGVTVYRFSDGSRYVYFTNRKGEVYEERRRSNGKTTSVERVQTLCE